MSTDNPLVDPDSQISYQNYGYDPNNPASMFLTEGYGKSKDEIDNIPLSGWLNGVAPLSDLSTLAQGVNDSSQALASAIEQGRWPDPSGLLETIAGVVEYGADVLSLDLDPLGTAVQWVVVWLFQHVPALRFCLDGLTGNPDAINGYATTWNNIATRVAEVAEEFGGTAKSGPGSWAGDASKQYEAMAQDTLSCLVAVAKSAKGLAVLITGLGQIVAGVRLLVANLIALVIKTLLIDLPEAIVGDEDAVISVAAQIAKLTAQVSKVIETLITVISTLATIASWFATLLAGIAGAAQRWSGGVV